MEVNDVHISLQKLADYFDPSLSLEEIEELYEAYATRDKTTDNDSEIHAKALEILSLNMVSQAKNDHNCSELLLEISNDMREIRTKPGFYNNSYDNWEFLLQKINVKHYLVFTYCMAGLAHLNPREGIYRKLSINSSRLYLLLIATPGAKRCCVFDNDVVITCLQTFKLIELRNLQPNDLYRLQIQLISLLEDMKIVFKIVCLELEEYKEVKEQLIVTVKDLLLYNFNSKFNNINLNTKCYEILEILCLPIHGEIKDTIKLILNKTSEFYKLQYKNIGINFRINPDIARNTTVNYEKIWDFFIHLLDLCPTDTAEILTKFIKAILFNHSDSIKADEYNHLLDVCAQYESAMFRKCNISIVEFLEEYYLTSDVVCRTNIIEFFGKMLLHDADVQWVLYQNEISSIPREIPIIKILFDRVLDSNNAIKQKVLNAFIKLFTSGNKNVLKILEYGFKNKTVDSSDPTTQQQPVLNGLDTLQTDFEEFIYKLYQLRNNYLANVRRSTLLLIELIIERDMSVITGELFDEVMLEFAQDASSIVRKQVIVLFNKLLKLYPNFRNLIDIWVRIVLILMRDDDTKICELTMDSLKQNMFDNIVCYEDSSQDKNYMPWLIVRSILKYGNRNILHTAIDSWIQNKFLTPKILSVIESHIYTSNCTEALIILSLISSKMKSRNPDMILRAFNELIQFDVYDSTINLHLILEVIKAWIKDFSRPVLNQIFNILTDILKTGSSNVTLIQYIYDVCRLISKISGKNKENSDTAWVANLNQTSKDYLLQNQESFINNNDAIDERFLNYMLIYSESNTDLLHHPDNKILDFFIQYINRVSKEKESFYLQQNNIFDRKVNLASVILTRFAIRNTEIASRIIPGFDNLLKKKNLRDSTTKTLIKLLNDLCKRHTSLVESVIRDIVGKLESPNASIKLLILDTLHELILQDYIKMRGHVLLNILASVVDENDEITTKAIALTLGYVKDRNPHLLHTCFLESVFVYNGYLQYDGLEMFPVSEMNHERSFLQGNRNADKRLSLYRFFVDNIDVINLLMLLKNLNLVYDKLKLKRFVKCSEGVNTLKDLLQIFKMIIDAKDRDKQVKTSSTANEEESNEAAAEAMLNIPSTSKKKGAKTMSDAIVVIEKMIAVYAKFDVLVRAFDASLAEYLDQLAGSLADKYDNLIEFALPKEFWSKYRKIKKKTAKKRRGSDAANDTTVDVEQDSAESETDEVVL